MTSMILFLARSSNNPKLFSSAFSALSSRRPASFSTTQERHFSWPPRATTTTSLSSTLLKSNDEDTQFDVIVIGGGHAGCEAAAAAARTGAKTALVTQKLHTVGELSCNPSIGGIGKGHLVREIDAMGGLMGRVADQAGIHYRVLNQRKGPAVRGPRAQMDRDLYKEAMQSALRDYPNLSLIEASAQDFMLEESESVGMESLAPFSVDESNMASNGLVGRSREEAKAQEKRIASSAHVGSGRQARICGAVVEQADGTRREIQARAVVVTTGTFLRGVLMLGHDRYAGGRHLRDSEQVEAPSIGLAQTLERFRFPLGRLKTGTPARLDGTTIDWDVLETQATDQPSQPFDHILLFYGQQPPNIEAGRTINCYQTATNEETHKLVMEYEHTLPVYDGLDGKGNGPRYCPSIYKKVQRFPDRTGHNCFLEPEGLNTDLVYPNGMSGPFPPDIQQRILRTMKGMGAVEIVRPGYDVEYDFVNPQALTHTLETKAIGGLYLAGQICGTTGYEEAGAQGIVAGANAGRAAAAAAAGEAPPVPLVLGRDEAYIGVLIDDLVTRGTQEPYRMFTSRAEYRITLRADNADLRLTRKSRDFGLLHDPERIGAFETREYLIQDRVAQLRDFTMKVPDWIERCGNDLLGYTHVDKWTNHKRTAEQILEMPSITLKHVEDIMAKVQKEQRQQQLNGDKTVNTDEEHVMTPSPPSIYDTVEATVKYQAYIVRQEQDMASWRKAQGLRIPPDIQYNLDTLPTLNLEEMEKLNATRPATFAQASQISGITPQSLVYLYHYVQKRHKDRDRQTAASATVTGSNNR